MAVKFEWHGDKEINIRKKQLFANMKEAMRFAEKSCKHLVSRGNKGGGNPSLPGEPPKVVIGNLRSSIDTATVKDATGVSGFLGVRKSADAGRYGFWLEFGTSKMAARPYLRPTIINNKDKLFRMIGKRR